MENGSPVATVGDTRITAVNNAEIVPGRDYVLAIRPDQIRFEAGGASGPTSIKVTVKTIRYRGLFYDIHAEFSNGEQLLMTHPVEGAGNLPATGEVVNISFSPGAPLILLQE
nr:TOBE domain-containing protein [Sneathiella litorea]